jgi:hypothetical protein
MGSNMKDDADLMDSLAQLDPVRGREPEPHEWIRSRARLEQIMNGHWLFRRTGPEGGCFGVGRCVRGWLWRLPRQR